ncbi:hypothetical protein TKO01_11790 [Tetragenococcus koreensis]|nr:hypothetical protein TKO01_11790 [Tetragenococcus koreensis]
MNEIATPKISEILKKEFMESLNSLAHALAKHMSLYQKFKIFYTIVGK